MFGQLRRLFNAFAAIAWMLSAALAVLVNTFALLNSLSSLKSHTVPSERLWVRAEDRSSSSASLGPNGKYQTLAGQHYKRAEPIPPD
jgi:hypothetical protein